LLFLCVLVLLFRGGWWGAGRGGAAPQVHRRAATAPAPLEPPISRAEIAVPLACKPPSHPQMSCVILAVIADQQASRVLYRQAATGEYRVNAPALGEGATD